MKNDEINKIYQAFKCLVEHDPKHLDSIINRPSGSQWFPHLGWQAIVAFPWVKLPASHYRIGLHLPQCDYYWSQSRFQVGYQGMKLLNEIKDLASVRIQEGAHGLELVSHEVSLVPTNLAWLIIGPNKSFNGRIVPSPTNKMVWTAYPGELSISCKHVPGFDGTLNSLIDKMHEFPIAVKAVNKNGKK